jgi:isopenicillin-N N-acyltransferase-like protein
VLFNMLRHTTDALAEERGLGFPVHLLSRHILDTARDTEEAVAACHAVKTSASTSLTVVDAGGSAASVELFPDGPGVVRPEDGVLVRTNHFLSVEGRDGCLAAGIGPSSGLRHATLVSAFTGSVPASAAEVVAAMEDHRDVGGVCAHPDRSMDPVLQHATLATVALDVAGGRLTVTAGGPCAR